MKNEGKITWRDYMPMSREAETLEILDNWTDEEVREQMSLFQNVLERRGAWEKLTRAEKDAEWEKLEN